MSNRTYSFAGIQLDTAKRQMCVGEMRKDVPPQVFDTLEFLAENSHRVVSKDQLAKALWPDTVVADSSIAQAVRKARRAIEECGIDGSIIKTQHGHGYRLDTEVRSFEVASDPDSGGELQGDPATESIWQTRTLRIGTIAAVLGGVLVTVANISEIMTWFVPDDSIEILEETRSTLETTDEKIDELVSLLRNQAAMTGSGLDPASENTIRVTIQTMLASGDSRKKIALDQLAEGDINAAVGTMKAVAQDLDAASAQSVAAAAASWREVGAIYYTSDIDEAVNAYRSAYTLQPDDPLNALNLAYAYIRAGRLDDATGSFGEVLAIHPSSEILTDALRGQAIAYKLQGNYDLAQSLLDRALNIAVEIRDLRQSSLVLLQLGAIARARGNNNVAREQFERAVAQAEEIGDQYLLAESLNNLGIIMAVTDEFDEAGDVLTKSYEIQVARRDLAGQATSLGNLGANALKRGDAEKAEYYLTESISLGEQLGWQRSIALDLINLGGIAAGREQYDLAASHLDRALKISVDTSLNEIRPIILVNLGEIARERGEPSEACRYWAESLPLLAAMEHNAAAIVEGYQDALNCP